MGLLPVAVFAITNILIPCSMFVTPQWYLTQREVIWAAAFVGRMAACLSNAATGTGLPQTSVLCSNIVLQLVLDMFSLWPRQWVSNKVAALACITFLFRWCNYAFSSLCCDCAPMCLPRQEQSLARTCVSLT